MKSPSRPSASPASTFESEVDNMRIDENALVWHEVEATPERLAEVFKDKQVLSCEPVDYPVTDAYFS